MQFFRAGGILSLIMNDEPNPILMNSTEQAGLWRRIRGAGGERQSSLLASLSGNIGFFLSLMVSQRLCGSPLYGGVFTLSAQMALLCLAVFASPAGRRLGRGERLRYALMSPLAVLISAAILLVFPWVAHREGVVLLLLYALVQMLGSALFVGTPLAGALCRQGRGAGLWAALYAVVAVLCAQVLYQLDFWAGVLAAAGLGIAALGLGRHRDPRPADDAASAARPDELRRGNAFRHFWAMNANIHVAVECSVQLLLCYLLALPVDSHWDALGRAVALVALFAVSGLVSRRFVRSRRLGAVGRNTLYIAFALLWLVINLRVNGNAERLDAGDIYATLAVVSLCVAVLFSVVHDMGLDIHTVNNLMNAQLDENAGRALNAAFEHWTLFVSRFSLLMVLGPLALAQDAVAPGGMDLPSILGKYALPLLPGFFLLLGLGAALRQPLTRQYEIKLQKYRELLSSGRVNRALEERLRLVLVQKYSKRIGIQIVKAILRPFFHLRLVHLERVDTAQFPAVFVCNHSEVYGPMAAVLNLPYYIRPWIIHEMVDRELIWEHTKGTVDRQTWLPAPVRRLVARIVVPITAWCMRSMEPIPVFRSDIREITRTLMASADALQAEDNILIFPEDPTRTDGYVREGVGEFYSGFVNIAKAYHRQSGRAVTFYSVYADKHRRTLSFSPGITFNPDAPFHEEKQRVTEGLRREMMALAGMVDASQTTSE